MLSGIYEIRNVINDMFYVSFSENLGVVKEQHIKNDIKAEYRKNPGLNAEINKIGIDNFEFSVLEYCNKESSNDRKSYWIKFYASFDHGYNGGFVANKNLIENESSLSEVGLVENKVNPNFAPNRRTNYSKENINKRVSSEEMINFNIYVNNRQNYIKDTKEVESINKLFKTLNDLNEKKRYDIEVIQWEVYNKNEKLWIKIEGTKSAKKNGRYQLKINKNNQKFEESMNFIETEYSKNAKPINKKAEKTRISIGRIRSSNNKKRLDFDNYNRQIRSITFSENRNKKRISYFVLSSFLQSKKISKKDDSEYKIDISITKKEAKLSFGKKSIKENIKGQIGNTKINYKSINEITVLIFNDSFELFINNHDITDGIGKFKGKKELQKYNGIHITLENIEEVKNIIKNIIYYVKKNK